QYNPVKLDGEIIEDKILAAIIGVILLYGVFFVICSIIMTFIIQTGGSNGYDLETAASSVVACLSNIGPGLSHVGAKMNYGFISPAGKWLLCFCMLLGRLEIYTVLLLLLPSTWKR
ncbi:potassium transporter TrkG, partial [Planctomycetota bacterium]